MSRWLVLSFGGGGNAWFLVVLFCVAVLAGALDSRTTRLWPAYVGLGAFVALGLIQPQGPVALGFGTFYVFILAYGAVYWVALRFARSAWRPATWVAVAALVSLDLAAGVFALVRQATGSQVGSWLMYVTASMAALAVLALAVDGRVPWERILRPMEWAREGTLGIYLVHVALIGYIFSLAPPIQPLLRSFAVAAVTFMLTAVVVSLARRWAPARAVL